MSRGESDNKHGTDVTHKVGGVSPGLPHTRHCWGCNRHLMDSIGSRLIGRLKLWHCAACVVARDQRLHEARTAQQVLKAEATRPDATDRASSANTSPVGGPMGAEQPAAAGLTGEVVA